MLRARVVGLFVLAAILALPGIARAQVVVGLYPVQGSLEPKVRADAEGLIVSGVRASDRRRGTFILRGPVPLKATCAPQATPECLAALGRGGAIIYAEAAMKDGVVSVDMSLITGTQKRVGPVNFRFMPGFLDLRPAHFAVEQLEKGLAALEPAPSAPNPEPKAEVQPAPKPVAAAPKASEEVDPDYDEKPSALTESLSDSLDDKPAPSASSKWMRKTGIYATLGGAVVLGAGGFFGLRGKSLGSDLSSRYTDGRLVPSDRSKYDQVKTYNTLANTLMIGGGVVALTGLTFWGLSGVSFAADDDGGSVNVRGRW